MTPAPEWAYWLVALGAILSPVVAYIVAGRNVEAALKVAKQQVRSSEQVAMRQVQASVVSSNRQKWIDGLRNDVAEFIAEGAIVRIQLSSPVQSNLADRTKVLLLVLNRIKLRLNPQEDDHRSLIELLDRFVQDPTAAEEPFSAEITDVAQKILKREWNRVKAGD